MDIGVPVKDLGEIDVAPLRDAILGIDDQAWFENNHRQTEYDVHAQTQSLMMLFVDTEVWPSVKVTREAAWDELSEVAMPLMDSILEKFYPPGGKVIRAMAAKLLSGGVIKPHTDKHQSFHVGHRIHIPITANPRVRFMIDGRPHKFQVGRVYELNNQIQHSVINKGTDDRINFIFDYVPPDQLAKLAS
ncbi:MAG: aspartyl/asparaginyl beta-hydroxylase domain-containing protein [Porticoccaceae bacterium]|jgi:hypothetical protein|nr:aspartyl/asparaginyl beta-hydroxylase domain-containing protein [Porticoccaceae bacterium]MDG1749913.1 aspartyl/asparaginyl beta-hydroxylase domain-containing protein [Porticoccaceae bacterium]|tara:strand:- start:126 stop:692 length:567 start_codon:yes stop_codon:yes gene_type:complete